MLISIYKGNRVDLNKRLIITSLVAGAVPRHASRDIWSVFVEHADADWCRCLGRYTGAALFRI